MKKAFTPLQTIVTRIKSRMSVTGFTYTELLVSILILALLTVGIFEVLNTANKTYYSNTGLLDLQREARRALDWMSRELREAYLSSVRIRDRGTRVDFDIPNEAGIRYFLNQGTSQIIRRGASGDTRILANDIDSLDYSLSGSILTIQLTAQKIVQKKSASFSREIKVGLRNE